MNRAADLALAIIKSLSDSKKETQAVDRANETHNLLLFLWAVEKSLTTKVTLGDPPDSEIFDNRCQSILAKLSPRRNRSTSSSKDKSPSTTSTVKTSPTRSKSSESGSSRSRSRSRSPNESRCRTNSRSRSRSRSRRNEPRRRDPKDANMEMVMMRNLTAMTASALKRDAREVRKKSMLSRLSPEAARLFSLLSAQDWQHKDPSLNSFMKSLVSDKDSQRALGIMQTQTKKWSGQVSDKGLMGFFASGYAARDIDEQPGGFTVFMFRPVSIHRPKSQRDIHGQVKAMFGKSELDDEAVKYYSTNDFFLADSVADLEEQIYTCIRCLELFTDRRGIATVGFEYGLQILQKDRRLFKNFLSRDPLFAVKFAYLLDRVFQNFVNELGNFYNEERPIHRSRSRLKNYQRDAIDRALTGYDVSSIPNLYLPSSLSAPPPTVPRPEPTRHERRDDRQPEPAWWSRNPNPVSNWGLPNGKKYADFYDSRNPDLRGNTLDWPKFPHHKTPDKTKPLCIRFQAVGQCNAKCYMSHVDPSKLDTVVKATFNARFESIYS
jgi:hypothetical protein